MKKILVSLSIVMITLFTGCGGGGDSASTTTTDTTTDSGATNMVIGTVYSMSQGGVITKVEDANISIETNTTSDITTATLLSGKATCTECTK